MEISRETDEMFDTVLNESMQYEGCSSLFVGGSSGDHTFDNVASLEPTGYGDMEQMVYDGMRCQPNNVREDDVPGMSCNTEEPPNSAAQRMYDMLDAAKQPLWPGCEMSQLAAAAELLSIKS